MVSYGGGNQSYSPSAPPTTDPQPPMLAHPYHPPPAQYPANPSMSYAPSTYPQSSTASFGLGPTPPSHGFGSYPYQQPQNLYSSFPPGTHPDVVRSFQMVDRNQNGYIEEMDSNKLSLGITKSSVFELYVCLSFSSGILENLLLESGQKSLLKYGVALANGGPFLKDLTGITVGKLML